MINRFASKLASLGFRLPHYCDPPSEELVADFESRFSLTLPADYREFLVCHGGMNGSAACAFQEPTPCGTSTVIDGFFGFAPPERSDNITTATERIDGAPDVIAIGDSFMGAMFWLMCSGENAGSVYMHDHQQRATWPDETFYDMYPNLSPDIEQYLAMRRQSALPRKSPGYEHVYRLAGNFTEFIETLQPPQRDPDADSSNEPSATQNGFFANVSAWCYRVGRKILPWAEDPERRSARISRGIACCDKALFQELVAAGNLDREDYYGWTPAQRAAGVDDMRPLQWMIKAGANLRGCLCMAAGRGLVEKVRILIAQGCDIEERCQGKTPLMFAVEFPNPPERVSDFVEVAQILIEKGANFYATSDEGQSVLEIAGAERYSNGRTHGQPAVVAFLESVDAKLKPSKPGRRT